MRRLRAATVRGKVLLADRDEREVKARVAAVQETAKVAASAVTELAAVVVRERAVHVPAAALAPVAVKGAEAVASRAATTLDVRVAVVAAPIRAPRTRRELIDSQWSVGGMAE
jgi:hypothetical protein